MKQESEQTEKSFYHYTTLSSLEKILKGALLLNSASNEKNAIFEVNPIWNGLTEYLFENQEYSRTLYSFFFNITHNKLWGKEIHELADKILEIRRHCYICCFSEEKDNEYLWDQYAKVDGVVLELSETCLPTVKGGPGLIWTNGQLGNFMSTVPMEYIRYSDHTMIKALSETIQVISKLQPTPLWQQILNGIYLPCLQIKHPMFSQEKEIRFNYFNQNIDFNVDSELWPGPHNIYTKESKVFLGIDLGHIKSINVKTESTKSKVQSLEQIVGNKIPVHHA